MFEDKRLNTQTLGAVMVLINEKYQNRICFSCFSHAQFTHMDLNNSLIQQERENENSLIEVV